MVPEKTYHIYNHANGNENLFLEAANYQFSLDQYKKHVQPVVNTFAYCLMPNHFHFQVQVKNVESLMELARVAETFPKFKTLEKLDPEQYPQFVSKQFSNFFSSYTQSFNKKYNRKGSLFIKNFRRKTIESIEQWQENLHYIHLNPTKHGFCDQLKDWKWNSWHAYNNLGAPSLINRSAALEYFDNIENLLYCSNEKRDRILNMELK